MSRTSYVDWPFLLGGMNAGRPIPKNPLGTPLVVMPRPVGRVVSDEAPLPPPRPLHETYVNRRIGYPGASLILRCWISDQADEPRVLAAVWDILLFEGVRRVSQPDYLQRAAELHEEMA